MRKLSILLALVAGLFATQAKADVTGKDASAATITWFDFICFTTKHCPGHVNINSAGTEIGTSSAEIFVGGRGTAGTPGGGVLTVQGAASMTKLLVTPDSVALPANQSVNVSQINGVTPLMGNGATGTGSPRVTIANDNTVPTGWPTAANQTAASAARGEGATGAAVPSGAKYFGLNVAGNLTGWTAKAGNTYSSTDVVPGVAVVNTLNPGRAAAASSSPVVTAPNTSTAGAIVPNNTTAVVVKASAGTLFGVQIYGIGSAPAYLKIYNATTATCGSGTPVKRLMIPAASTAANGAGSNITFGAGLAFGTGITYCVTTGIGDADTTAPAASTFLVNVDYE